MKILVCGGRTYREGPRLFSYLDALHAEVGVTLVIHGDARGADRLAGGWANQRGIEQRAYPANWEKHGKAAGFRRNEEMLRRGQPDMVVAFPGGPGTRSMCDLARAAGVRLRIVPPV